MANFFASPIGFAAMPQFVPTYQAATSSGFRIDAAAKGVAFLFVPSVSEKLTDVYVFVTAVLGTPPTLTLTVNDFTGTTTIGSALANYSTTATGRNSALGWVKFTFSNSLRAALTAGKPYFLKLTSSGDASNYNDIATATGVQGVSTQYLNWASYSTINSFSTLSVVNRNSFPLCLTYETVSQGMPYTRAVQPTSSSNTRGLYIPSLLAPISIGGINWSSIASLNNIEIYRVGQGSPDHTISAADSGTLALILFSPKNFSAGQAYRVVGSYTANNARPGYVEIEDPDNYQALLDCRYGGDWHYTELVSGTWTEFPKRFPCLSVYLSVATVASGGSGGLLVRPQFNGGFSG